MLEKNWDCGVARAMAVLGGKWKLNIIWRLANTDALRFNELKRAVKGITNIMLARSLEDLIQYQLITKKDYQTIPPHTEYRLSEKGKELIPFLQSLDTWGRKNL